MAAAVAKREEDAFEARAALPSRAEVLARYRHLREISGRHQQEVVDLLSDDAVVYQARRLGLAIGRTIIADDKEMKYAFDLAIHTAPPNRTPAINRYARAARFAPESDEARLLEAMRNSQFTLFRVDRRHETAGLIVTDLVRRKEIWLVDEAMERTGLRNGPVRDTNLRARCFLDDRWGRRAARHRIVGGCALRGAATGSQGQ